MPVTTTRLLTPSCVGEAAASVGERRDVLQSTHVAALRLQNGAARLAMPPTHLVGVRLRFHSAACCRTLLLLLLPLLLLLLHCTSSSAAAAKLGSRTLRAGVRGRAAGTVVSDGGCCWHTLWLTGGCIGHDNDAAAQGAQRSSPEPQRTRSSENGSSAPSPAGVTHTCVEKALGCRPAGRARASIPAGANVPCERRNRGCCKLSWAGLQHSPCIICTAVVLLLRDQLCAAPAARIWRGQTPGHCPDAVEACSGADRARARRKRLSRNLTAEL
jgi:hypothetical protein